MVWKLSASALVIVCAWAVGLGAQTAVTPTAQSDANRAVVTGCLELTEQSPVGTSGVVGTAGTAVPDTTFVLTSARAAARPATAKPAASSPTPLTYRISTIEEGKLWSHVGHRVEITGTLATTSASSSRVLPLLVVQSVKMVSPSCVG